MPTLIDSSGVRPGSPRSSELVETKWRQSGWSARDVTQDGFRIHALQPCSLCLAAGSIGKRCPPLTPEERFAQEDGRSDGDSGIRDVFWWLSPIDLPGSLILPSPDVAETLRKSHGVSRLVGAVVGTLDLLDLECHRVERGSRCRDVRMHPHQHRADDPPREGGRQPTVGRVPESTSMNNEGWEG